MLIRNHIGLLKFLHQEEKAESTENTRKKQLEEEIKLIDIKNIKYTLIYIIMFSSMSRSLGNMSGNVVGSSGLDIFYKVPLPSSGMSGALKTSQAKDLQEATQKVTTQQNSGKIPKGQVSISEVTNPLNNKKEWLATITTNKFGGKSRRHKKTRRHRKTRRY